MVSHTDPSVSAPLSRRLVWAGLTLGFSLGGFFDGIVLHQVLQWHHLLSALQDGALDNLRAQILADGLFHALMYVIGALGLYLLLPRRHELNEGGATRRLMMYVLLGFGSWHVIDAVFSHWVLGIHRIRMDVENPLAWDLGWLLIFGGIPLIGAWWLRKRSRPGAGAGTGGGMAAILVAAGVGLSAVLNLSPVRQGDKDTVTVVLRPGATPAQLFAGMDATGARLLWNDSDGGVWLLKRGPKTDPAAFYRYGAMYVAGTTVGAGCIDWLQL